MTPNDLFAAAPELMKKWAGMSVAAVSSLEPSLIQLVEIRVSQINGCANCINMHAEEARARGETEQHISVQQGGTGQTHIDDHRHQWMEPHFDGLRHFCRSDRSQVCG